MTHYSNVFETVPLDTDDVAQALLDIEHKTRSNPLKWTGQFSPQLVNVLISKYGCKSSRIFDPFLGSGTVLLEAGRIGITACGSELNPAAVILARTYEFINVEPTKRKQTVDLLNLRLEELFPIEWNYYRDAANSDSALQIMASLTELHGQLDSYLSNVLIEALIILVDFHKVEDLSINKVLKTWNKLKHHVLNLPSTLNQIAVYHADARNTPIADSTIDFVITSPPYINVFNYHQQYRRSAEALNWELLSIAKSEFGSNRKHRGNRFFTVTQYCIDIAHTLTEISRITNDSSRCIFVLGRESKVCGTPFYNGAIFMNLANKLGFQSPMRQERKFRNRFGKNIVEDIIHLHPPKGQLKQGELLNSIAKEVSLKALQDSLDIVPQKSRRFLEQAIRSV
ncbi:MAG: DNA methyltransferase, partial [Candidatus Promineifilaceae bacterium]